MYTWAELIKLWEHQQVTEVQVIGQLLKQGEAQQAQIVGLQRRLEQVEHPVTPRQGTQPPSATPGETARVRR